MFFTGLAANSQNPVVQFVITSATVSEGLGYYGVNVYITNYNSNPTSVDINVLPGGTATHGVNFTYNPVTVTFPANSPLEQTVGITIIDDSIADSSKWFTFKLANPTNNATIGVDSEFTLTMTNVDTVKFNLPSPLTVPKNAGIITFPVDMDPIKSDSVTHVKVSVVGGGTTAVQGVDYRFNDTIISWAALTRGIIQIPVTILNDTLIEPNRIVEFTLTDSTTGIPLTDSIFTLTILEDDSGPPAVIGFKMPYDSIADPDSAISGYIYIVGVTGYNPGNDTVSFYVVPNAALSTALNGNGPPADFQYDANLLMIPPGGSLDTNLGIELFPNPEISPTKQAVFQFASIFGNATISSDSIFTLYITNHNKLIVSFLGAALSYPKDTPLVMIPVVMSTFPNVPVSVDVSLAPGSAILGVDYAFDDTTVIFPPYSNDTQGVWVHIINNSIYQPNKQINFNLSNPSNGVLLGITGYTLTIINDDSLLDVSKVPANNSFSLFPNPATTELFIECPENTAQMDVYDILGNTLLTKIVLEKGENDIDIAHLPPGAYIAKVVSGMENQSIPFIKGK